MSKHLTDFSTRVLTALSVGTICGAIFIFLPPLYFSVLLASAGIIMLAVEWIKFPYWTWVITPFYLLLSLALLIYLNQSSVYHTLLYYLFLMVFAHDTGAYIAGSLWGTTKMAPRISPKKTWEGALGGYLSTIAVLISMLLYFDKPLPPVFIALFSLGVALVATVGDFFESWLKRKAGLKNSGSLLPGHGGLLDRFDSILSVTFLFFLLRDYLSSFL